MNKTCFLLIGLAFWVTRLTSAEGIESTNDFSFHVLIQALQGRTNLNTNTWTETSVNGNKTIRQWNEPDAIFSFLPQQVLGYWEKDTLERIEIIFLEAGNFFGVRASDELLDQVASIEVKRERRLQQKKLRELREEEEQEQLVKKEEFEKLFKKMKAELPLSLEKASGNRGKIITVGRSDLLRTRLLEYFYQEINLRLLTEENQLIALTLASSSDLSKNWSNAAITNLIQARKTVSENVKTLANGDVIIDNVPMFDQGNRGYCAIGTLAMVLQYYGLNLNIDALAAKAGYREGDVANAALEPVYYASAKEAKMRIETWPKLEFREVQKTILKGQPILIWRAFRRERDDFHTDFAQRYLKNPSLQLLDPKRDRTESSRWATLAHGAHASLITGFNKARNEILFTESWGEMYRNRRMRYEEMKETVHGIFILEQ